jgi:hypothetical protein
MDALAVQLDTKLHEWSSETATQVRRLVAEIIECAEFNVLDIARSRSVEQEVLDLIDEPTTR